MPSQHNPQSSVKLAPAPHKNVLCKDLQAALLTLQHYKHDPAEQGAHLWGWETWTTVVLKGRRKHLRCYHQPPQR